MTNAAHGKRHLDRPVHRNSYRNWLPPARAGEVELRATKLRKRHHFLDFLDPRHLAR